MEKNKRPAATTGTERVEGKQPASAYKNIVCKGSWSSFHNRNKIFIIIIILKKPKNSFLFTWDEF